MGSKNLYDDLARDISRIESKIQQVYCCPDSYKQGKEFETELFQIEQGLKINSHSKPANGVFPHEEPLVRQVPSLEARIDAFLEQQDIQEELRRKKNQFTERIQTLVVQQMGSLPTNELWENMSTIINEWNHLGHNEIERGEFQRTVRETVLDLLIISAKRDEPINLNNASRFCSKEDLVKAIRAKLIAIAQTNDGNNKDRILFKARYLQPETIKEPELWQLLTDNSNVSFIGSIQELAHIRPKISKPYQPNTTALAVIKPKENLWRRLFHIKSKPKTTIYTFGEINPENGEWEKVNVVADKFPKKLSKKQIDRLLALEINDVDTIDENNYSNYKNASNLQRIVFGRVKHISARKRIHQSWESFSDSLCDFDGSLFSENTSLSSVEISNNVERISAYAFYDCSSLQEVHLPESITSLDRNTFASCKQLSAFSAPGLESIGYGCFDCCSSLVDFRFGEKLVDIGGYAFRCCMSLTEVHLPESTTYVGDNAFDACASMQSIYFPDSVKNIPNQCCYGCTSLTDVQLGRSLKEIGKQAFYNCTALKHIDIPAAICKIGNEAFKNCDSLTDVTFDEETELILTDNDQELAINDRKSLRKHIFTGCLKIKLRYRNDKQGQKESEELPKREQSPIRIKAHLKDKKDSKKGLDDPR